LVGLAGWLAGAGRVEAGAGPGFAGAEFAGAEFAGAEFAGAELVGAGFAGALLVAVLLVAVLLVGWAARSVPGRPVGALAGAVLAVVSTCPFDPLSMVGLVADG
jgi:uncharacterized protein YjbI with pentapeptide repeats